MLTIQNKKLLDALEAKYVTLLAVVADIAKIEMGNAATTNTLERYITEQQQDIELAASVLRKDLNK